MSRRRTHGRAMQRTSRGRKEGQWEVEAKFHALSQDVQRLAQECARILKALLEDVLEREGGETGRLCDEQHVEGYQSTLLRVQLIQAEQQQGELMTDQNIGLGR